jgi:hypothetical protein
MLKLAPIDWGVIYLGWCLEKCEQLTPAVSPAAAKPNDSNKSIHLFKAARPLCTHAYAVSHAGATLLLKDLLASPQTLDHS